MDALRQGIRDVNRAQRSENSDVQKATVIKKRDRA